MQVITREELEQQGIASAEQMIMALNINGNGLDNLASNADVVAGAQRGNNGATSANLRGQGNNATLILLNGRRVASYGLNGGTVDLNSIPFSAIERIEVLKDGASATYGTDAIGGVINFILRENFIGLRANAATDFTQDGGGQISRYSVTAGFGDLEKEKFNIMAIASVTDVKKLRGDQRDWDTTFAVDRGLSPDTRGPPIATIFAITTLYNALSRDNINTTGRGTGPLDPVNSAQRVNGINIIDLPTNTAGYAGLDGMGPYDEVLWNSPASKYASAWDTGRAAVLQQPVKNTNLVVRGTGMLGKHKLIAEAVVGRTESTKSFSPSQWTSSTAANTTAADGITVVPNPLFNLAYPSTGADYTR
ncbi:MAG: TonB-dependent receptor plug domain-containing protein, partial [Burkholderiales bacterium]